MNDYRFKRWLIIGGSLSAIGVLYWVIYFIRYISTSRVVNTWFENATYIGYLFCGVGLAVLLGDMIWALIAARHPEQEEHNEKNEEDSLDKYKSNKK